MQPQTEFLDSLCSMISGVVPYQCTVGPLPPCPGVSLEITAGLTETVYLDRKEGHRLTLLILTKHKKQMEAHDMAAQIRNYLAKLSDYPDGDGYEWTSIDAQDPTWVGQQDGHIYEVTCEATIYF